MTTDFKEVMSERTDKELIRIVTVDRDSYQPMAVEAAEVEIKSRDLDATKIEQVKNDLVYAVEKQKQFDAKKISSWTRLIHFSIDSIAFLILTVILTFIHRLFAGPIDKAFTDIFGYLMLSIGFFGYYIFMETKYQKTIGKFMTRTKVVMRNGSKPEINDILRRTFCRLIPLDNVSYLFNSNGYHDRLSDTTLIKDEIVTVDKSLT